MSPPPGTAPTASLRGASAGPFPVITLIVVIVIGLASFLTASYLQIFDDGSGEPFTTGPSAFSRSAIGHRALAEILRRLGIPVEISRFDSLAKAGPNSLLLVIEPDLEGPGKRLLEHLRDVPHALLVLPKWAGRTDRQKPIWIDRMKQRPEEDPLGVLQSLLPDARIVRLKGPETIHSEQFGGTVKINDPQFFVNASADTVSLLDATGATLLGKVGAGDRELWILSDPDLLSNSGIDDADNGVVAISIIETLLPKGGTVIIDETAHGFEQRPNLMRILLHPPFVIVLIAGVVALILLIWAGVVRFGAAESETAQLAAGKLTLVRNAAQLLRLGTSAATLLQNYRRLSVANVYAELHGRAGLDDSAQAAWLDRAAVRRGLVPRLEKLLNRIAVLAEANRLDAGKALGFALELHRWKQEILNGTVVPRTG